MRLTEGTGSSPVGRIRILNKSLDKTSSPGLACSHSKGKVPWVHQSWEEVRALSFTSRTEARHHVKAHIQNCIKRERQKKKKQNADCHCWSLSFKKRIFFFGSPLLSCRKERLYWTSVHTVLHFTGSLTHFEVNMNCKSSIQGGKHLKWVQDYS